MLVPLLVNIVELYKCEYMSVSRKQVIGRPYRTAPLLCAVGGYSALIKDLLLSLVRVGKG